MTDRTLPLLFVNLGGEMLYIIEDRLTSQEIASDKTKKGEQNRKKDCAKYKYKVTTRLKFLYSNVLEIFI